MSQDPKASSCSSRSQTEKRSVLSEREQEQKTLRVELRVRGIFKPERLLALASTDAIAGAIRWYDEQRERSEAISPGVLANAIIDGGMPGYGLRADAPTCPTTPELELEWVKALAQFDDDFALVWGQRCHPHAHDSGGWTLGAERWVTSWIGKYLPVIRRELSAPVSIVVCNESSPDGEAAQSVAPRRPVPAVPGAAPRPAAPPDPDPQTKEAR